MGRVHDEIGDELAAWMVDQPVFFVGTAPLAGDGNVNVSPKGLEGSFAVLGPSTVAYLDLTGSGIETMAHLAENGRICVMFCAFSGKPRIVRLHGRGTAHPLGSARFDELAPRFAARSGARSIIEVAVNRLSDSCGFGVPTMRLAGHRDQLLRWADARDGDAIEAYRRTRNATSIDGLPGWVPAEAPAPEGAAAVKPG